MAVVVWLGVLSLIIFYSISGGPFGLINDVANGLVGLLSISLAWLWLPNAERVDQAGHCCATVGAMVTVSGSILIIFDITGWYLAGLVSSVGNALIGIWLLLSNRLHRQDSELPRGLIMLGVTAGIFMIIGLLALPGRTGWHRRSAGCPGVRQRGFAQLDGNVFALPNLVLVAQP